VVEDLTPAPEWFGTYGHIDWGQYFDWWRGDVRSATTTEQPSPPPPATPTPATPVREIVLAAPEEDATVINPVEVRGRVSVMPFEGNLRGRVYDAQGQVVGEAPIQAQPDTEGELGGPGTFAGTIPFQVETSGPGRVEIAEISARDGSVVVSATAAVTLTETPPPDLSKMDVREWSSTSPDGAWVARGLAAFPKNSGGNRYYTRLTVARSDGSQEWPVVESWSELALGYTTPRPLRWSEDGRYLYFTNRPVPDGCAVFVNGSDLQRVDLADGSVREIVPPVGLWLSLSPDERQLAYVGYGDRGLVVRDLSTGRERQTQVEAAQETGDAHVGHVIWSSDGEALVLTVAIDACGPPGERVHTIVRIDAETLSQTTLITEDERLFTSEAWSERGRVSLRDPDGKRWWLDPRTGELTPAD